MTTHPQLDRGQRKSRAIAPLPHCVFKACYNVNFTFYSTFDQLILSLTRQNEVITTGTTSFHSFTDSVVYQDR